MRIATGAIEFLVEGFVKQAAVVQAGERIGDGIALQALELFIFENNGQTKSAGGGKNVDERGLKRDQRIGALGKLRAAGEHLLPHGDHLVFRKVDARKRLKETLKELRTRSRLETLERFD